MATFYKSIFFPLIILALLTTACQAEMPPQPSPIPSSTAVQVLPGEEGYPYPGMVVNTPVSNAYEEGYPATEFTPVAIQLPESLEIPEPGKDAGIVIGQLVSGPEKKPFLGALYLGRTLTADKADQPPIVAFSDSTDPLAVQDRNGNFLFTDISPGTYALVIWNPVTSTVIEDEESNEYLLVDVEAGEITDLGTITLP